jgi:aminopeptidase N
MSPARGVTRRPVLRTAYAVPAYVVERISLVIDLDPTQTRVAATLDIRRAPGTPASAPLVLQGEGQALHAFASTGCR